MFKTRITELLGIKYPIIQGAMLWLSRPELAAAVSNAGGLGIIDAAGCADATALREEIRKTRSLTDKPFAVNITLLPSKRPIDHAQLFQTAFEEGVRIIETSGRSPEPYMDLLKKAKVTVLHKVARVRDAKTAERLGVDAVTIVGFEAGGHPGAEDVTSLVRIPVCADSLKIPVIAAGGFADGRGLVAALALGAEGVLMGTRFMASQECPLHPKIKQFLLDTEENNTILIERSINMHARVIRTDFSQKIAEMEQKGVTFEELFPMIAGARCQRAYQTGETNDSILYAGQGIGLVHDVPSVKEIIERIIREAGQVMEQLQSRIK